MTEEAKKKWFTVYGLANEKTFEQFTLGSAGRPILPVARMHTIDFIEDGFNFGWSFDTLLGSWQPCDVPTRVPLWTTMPVTCGLSRLEVLIRLYSDGELGLENLAIDLGAYGWVKPKEVTILTRNVEAFWNRADE